MNAKKILITGANGLLGASLRKSLLEHNFFVIATGLGPDRFPQLSHVYEPMDVTSLKACSDVINRHKPDIIINAAALTNVDECEQKKDLCVSVNTNSLWNYIPFIEKHKIHLIHISTDFVFSGEKGQYHEYDNCSPKNLYGLSKLESENILMKQSFNATVIRTSLVYGDDENCPNFFTWVKSNLEKNIELQIVSDQYRTPTFVFDLVQAILHVVKMEKYGLYHISSGEVLSIYEIVCNIAECCGFNPTLIKKINSARLNQIAQRPIDSTLSIEKAIKELDFCPTTLNNALKKIL